MSPLVRKEIRLVLPSWFAALALAVLPVWLVWSVGHNRSPAPPGFLVYAPFAIGVLLLGLASFGQELSLGTFSTLLALPVSRRRIWRVKTGILFIAALSVFCAFYVSNWIRVEQEGRNLIERATLQDRQLAESLRGRKLPPELRKQAEANAARSLELLEGMRQGLITDTLETSIWVGGFWVMAAVAGGLWTTLLFRNTAVAFWLALLAPVSLVMLVIMIGSSGLIPEQFMGLAYDAAGGGYSLAGYFWARNYLPRAGDNAWTGGVVSIPSWRWGRDSTASSTRVYQPLRALLRNELQLHQVNLLVGGVLLVAHLGVLAVRRWFEGYLLTHHQIAMILEPWPLLWLVMPLLIGAAAVAEERKLGTLESQLCLPFSRGRAFGVKLLTALALGSLLGTVVPFFLEALGSPGGMMDRNGVYASFTTDNTLLWALAGLLGFSAGLVLISLHASSLTRNLLQALGWAAVFTCFWVAIWAGGIYLAAVLPSSRWSPMPWQGPLIAWSGAVAVVGSLIVLVWRSTRNLLKALRWAVVFLCFWAAVWALANYFPGDSPSLRPSSRPWQGMALAWIGVPVLAGTLIALVYRNYRELQPGPKAWRRNGATLVAAIMVVCLVSTGLSYIG